MGIFTDSLILLSVIVWLLGLSIKGYLSQQQTAAFIFGIVLLVAISRVKKIGLGRLTFRVGLPVASLLTFVLTYSQGNISQFASIFGSILILFIVVCGLYLMIVGPFRRK